MKLTAKQRKYYSELSRKIAVGLASGLLFVGIGQYPSIAFAHPDPSTTGSYSTTGDVSGGKYTVERGSGLAVTTEAAGGAAVNQRLRRLCLPRRSCCCGSYAEQSRIERHH